MEDLEFKKSDFDFAGQERESKSEVLKRADRAGDEAAFALARIVANLPADVVVALQSDIDYVIAYMACGAEIMAEVAKREVIQ